MNTKEMPRKPEHDQKKAPARRLRLAKETLRTLTTDELRLVAGGLSTGSRFC